MQGILVLFVETGMAENEMTQGIVFKKLHDTIISEDEWKIVLDFNMIEIRDELESLKTLCTDLVYYTNTSVNVWDEDFAFEYSRIKTGIDQYESDVSDLFRLLPTERSKRGLVDAGGYALKWLFGVPTSEDMEQVNSKVEEIKKISGSLLSSRENQITLMKDMNEKMLCFVTGKCQPVRGCPQLLSGKPQPFE
ncbi:hypothetical protein J6590_102008 [Homalodisca vitripennis]|nr:hypothetical protein J6590_102008 [Homalodisca vitripennis]